MVKRRCIGLIAGLVIATTGWAAPSSPSLIATPPQPKWSELSVKQKIVLAPLSDDWDSLEFFRQKKWIGIADRFTKMSPDEQRRVQVQMQEWGKLSPEQRQLARENFKTANRLPAEKKQELRQKWEEYSGLPEEEKEKLKQQAANKSPAMPGATASAAPLFAAPVTPIAPIAPVASAHPTTEAEASPATDRTSKP